MKNIEDNYEPMMSKERARQLRAWQDEAYANRDKLGDQETEYLGLTLHVPAEVQPMTPMSDLLGRAVLEEVRPGDRVLDVGTGSGVNAILAASQASEVMAIDINPHAVEAARANAEHNAVSSRVQVIESDLFSNVDGCFDLIIIDPPFRWFAPRDIREAATTDENYRMLTRFFHEVHQYLADEGRILIFFGTSGDSAYLHKLISESGFDVDKLGSRQLEKSGLQIEYFTYRLTRNNAAQNPGVE